MLPLSAAVWRQVPEVPTQLSLVLIVGVLITVTVTSVRASRREVVTQREKVAAEP